MYPRATATPESEYRKARRLRRKEKQAHRNEARCSRAEKAPTYWTTLLQRAVQQRSIPMRQKAVHQEMRPVGPRQRVEQQERE